jgi:hypothetical protein
MLTQLGWHVLRKFPVQQQPALFKGLAQGRHVQTSAGGGIKRRLA